MNQIARRPIPAMTADEFLAWPGDGSGRKFELVDGEVRAMAPASTTHSIIQGWIVFFLTEREVNGASKLGIGIEGAVVPGLRPDMNIRVPDVVGTLDASEKGQLTFLRPVLLVEILSPSNQSDTRENVRAYQTIASVMEIAVVHSTRIAAEIHRRGADGAWPAEPEKVEAGGRLRLATADLDRPLRDAYRNTWLDRSGS